MFLPKINKINPDKHEFLQITADIAKPVKSLWFMGNLPNRGNTPVIAIVGSRKPTPYGREMTYRLSYDLASRGAIIVSGLALGIDAIAHQAALEAGGVTIAVLANGLDKIYPSTNQNLAEKIVESGGAIISEYEPGILARQHQFLERNRIVSGLSDGVIVIEAAARSGTLATANHALDQGRVVMAVPGNATSPMSAGCNKLIKAGAALITDADDVFDALGRFNENLQTALPLAETLEEKVLLELMQSGVRDGDELQQQSKLDAAVFSQTLSMLEITGKVRALGANNWSIK